MRYEKVLENIIKFMMYNLVVIKLTTKMKYYI